MGSQAPCRSEGMNKAPDGGAQSMILTTEYFDAER